ncbi:MAG: hypothetical protein HWN81_17570 [Candidatus Lokiarchaeota archaeon]|nr:hypothetical protein [Candidatus Lokiarchaeota archaeon]
MSNFLKEFKFEKSPLKITYLDKEPLKLSNELIFFHNKSKFRKYLTQLQYLIKSYTNTPLHAAGIRDSYLKEEFSEKFLIVLLSTSETIKRTNEIIKPHSEMELNNGCFYLEVDTNFMFLLSRDMEGLILGVNTMEIILKQIMEDYMNQKQFDDYIKICSFKLTDCVKSV